jgi:hypothetical protein
VSPVLPVSPAPSGASPPPPELSQAASSRHIKRTPVLQSALLVIIQPPVALRGITAYP